MPSVNIETPRSRAPTGMREKMIGWRTERGLTQADLADRARLSLKTVQRFENGARPSAHTVTRLQCALDRELDMEDELVAPEWTVPSSPHGDTYGSRVRALRLALGMTLDELAGACGISAAKLSRFERDISIPHGWIVEWIDEADRDRDALVFKPLAKALGFEEVRGLHEFCRSTDVEHYWFEGGLTPDKRERLRTNRFFVYPDMEFPVSQQQLKEGHARWLTRRRRGKAKLPRR